MAEDMNRKWNSTMDTQTAKLGTSQSLWDCIDKLMSITDITFEFFVAICIGAIIGWLFGLCAGHIYVDHYQPVYASEYSSLSKVSEWASKPGIVASIGAHIGAIVGMIFMLILWIRAWRKRTRIKNEKKLHMKVRRPANTKDNFMSARLSSGLY